MSENDIPVKTEQEVHTNPMLALAVNKDSELKKLSSRICWFKTR